MNMLDRLIENFLPNSPSSQACSSNLKFSTRNKKSGIKAGLFVVCAGWEIVPYRNSTPIGSATADTQSGFDSTTEASPRLLSSHNIVALLLIVRDGRIELPTAVWKTAIIPFN